MNVPTIQDVHRIAALADPVVRNMQITQCYYELSQAVARLSGREANWCTFATWASRQAGQTIRGEDLVQAVEDLYAHAPEAQAILSGIQLALARLGKQPDVDYLRRVLFSTLDPQAALRRAGEAVARGNLKVFQEIGYEFARFLATFEDVHAIDTEKVLQFCAALRPGEPPEGQRLLRDAFTAYAEACVTADPKARAEQMFFANLLVGFHEQTRLQPEIAAAMDASLGDVEVLRQRLLKTLLPGFWLRLRLQVARLLKGQLPLDVALDQLIDHMQKRVRRVLTEALMTLRLPEDRVLRLGRSLNVPFPRLLTALTQPDLTALLVQIDPTPDSPLDSGTDDWASFPDRMHFIADFFRCYHAWAPLFDAPFTVAVGRLDG